MLRDESAPVLHRPSRRLALLVHRRRVQGITKKLYRLRPLDQDSQASLKLKTQINALKSASIRTQKQQTSQSFSSIRNLSVEMLNDMLRARRKKEVSVSLIEEEPTEHSASTELKPIGTDASRVRIPRIRPSILDMKALSQQMSPLLHRTEQALREEEEKSVKSLSSSFIQKRELSATHALQARDVGELRRDLKSLWKKAMELDRKTKLYVTSIALLEDELRDLVADCLEFKRSLIRKKLDSAYRELRKVKDEQAVVQSQRHQLERELKQLASMPVTPFCLD